MNLHDWTQTITIIGVNVALFGLFATVFYWMINRLDKDINACGLEVKSLASRLDGHAMRIDQLYRMFVELLKEGKK
jgi:hypothetical protein